MNAATKKDIRYANPTMDIVSPIRNYPRGISHPKRSSFKTGWVAVTKLEWFFFFMAGLALVEGTKLVIVLTTINWAQSLAH